MSSVLTLNPYHPPIFENIPPELQTYLQWVSWIAVPNEERGKPDKVPVDVRTGRAASVSKSDSWSSYDEAVNFYQSNPGALHTVSTKEGPRTGAIAGIGFVLTKTDPFVGIDIDKCIGSDHKIAPWAQDVIECMGSYTEISPSGTGVRIFVKGDWPGSWSKNVALDLEVYKTGRYLTVTGHAI